MTTTSITSGTDFIGKTLIIGSTGSENRTYSRILDFNNNSTNAYIYAMYQFNNQRPWVGFKPIGGGESAVTYNYSAQTNIYYIYALSFISTTEIKYNIYEYNILASTITSKGTITTFTTPNTFLSSLTHFWLGRSAYNRDFFYNGYFSKVTLYNGNLFALTDANILSTLFTVVSSTQTNIINNSTTYTFRPLGPNFLGVVVNILNYNTISGSTVTTSNITLLGSGSSTTIGGYLNIIGSYIETIPNVPTAVSAIAGNGNAAISWTAPVNNGGSAITSYTVTSSPGNFQATTANGSTTTATVTGLTNGTAYTFTVVATNVAGPSAASAASSPVTPISGLTTSNNIGSIYATTISSEKYIFITSQNIELSGNVIIKDGLNISNGSLNCNSLIPNVTNSASLGSTSKIWSNAYISDVSVNNNLQVTGNVIINGNLDASNIYTKSQVDASFGNVYTKAQIDASLANVYTKSQVDLSFANVYTKSQVDLSFSNVYTKAFFDASFSNVYTKEYIDASFSNVYTKEFVDASLSNVYTKEYVDASLVNVYTKAFIDASLSNVYTKNQVDASFGNVYTKNQVDASFANVYTKSQVDASFSNVYTKSQIDASFLNVYTKSQVDLSLANIYTKAYVDVSLSNVYTKSRVDASFSNVYTKAFIDASFTNVYIKSRVDASFSNVYTKSQIDLSFGNVYTKGQVDTSFLNVYTRSQVDVSFVSKQLFEASYNVLAAGGGGGGGSVNLSSVSSNIVPSVTNTYTLGSTTNYWSNAYIRDLSLSNRAYQEISGDISWSAVNGYYGLAKDAYPSLNPLSSGVKAVQTWTGRVSSNESATWHSVCWSPKLGIFAAVARSSQVMTSPNGTTWTEQTPANANGWHSVCWCPELSLFVAVAVDGGSNKVMTSPDGINWTARTSPVNQWMSVCWSKELTLFVAVAYGGSIRVMTSPNGIDWTGQTSTNNSNNWLCVCWSPELGLFVAVATDGSNKVMTSPDGKNWTGRLSSNELNQWQSVCWSKELGLFVAVAYSGSNKVMTSPNGITWTGLTSSNESNGWISICWSPQLGLFVAIAVDGGSNKVMTSPDGINWTGRTSSNESNGWWNVCWSPQLSLFAAVALEGSNRVMTSSLRGRPPTSYNVFDSSFNSIDETGKWTFANVAVSGTITAGGAGAAVTSDDRLKHNEVIINNGLAVIDKLCPKFYQKTQVMLDASYNGYLSGYAWNYEAGLIAQEVLQTGEINFVVSGGDYYESVMNYDLSVNDLSVNDLSGVDLSYALRSANYYEVSNNLIKKPYALNYNSIFTYGLAAVKELHTKVKAQEANILDQQLNSLITRIETLETQASISNNEA